MFTIHLNDLQFFAHHGVHEEERLLGNNFLVNVSLVIDAKEKVTSITQTVNYVAVFNIVKMQMANPTPLLETLAQDIASAIYDLDHRIRSISVMIEKKDPPIVAMQGSVGVSFFKEY